MRGESKDELMMRRSQKEQKAGCSQKETCSMQQHFDTAWADPTE